MTTDEIQAKMARLKELVELVSNGEKDPQASEFMKIGMELLEGALKNISNATFFLENLYVMEEQKRING